MNIICIAPVPHDGTSFYRALGPLNALQRKYPDVHVQYDCESYSWHELSWGDVLFLQRPSKAAHLNLANYAKSLNMKVWVDFDDNLFSVGTSNPTFRMFSKPEARKVISECTGLADLVTVSTKALADVYKSNNTVVVPNAYPDYLLPLLDKKPPKNHKVMWRGSNTHSKDLMGVADDLIKFIREKPKVQFEWIGYLPWFLTDHATHTNCRSHDIMDCVTMYNQLSSLNASVAIVPLYDDNFNRCKSNCAWLEYSTSGAMTLAPSMPEWNRPGVQHYAPGSFYKALNEAFEMSFDERAANVKASQDYIKKNLLLDDVNDKRLKLLKDLL